MTIGPSIMHPLCGRRPYLRNAFLNICSLSGSASIVIFCGFMLWPSWGSLWILCTICHSLPSQASMFLREVYSPTTYHATLGIMAIIGVSMSRRPVTNLAALWCVLLIHRQLNGLSAHEVLLRGSIYPARASHELLRAAQNAMTNATESLRADRVWPNEGLSKLEPHCQYNRLGHGGRAEATVLIFTVEPRNDCT